MSDPEASALIMDTTTTSYQVKTTARHHHAWDLGDFADIAQLMPDVKVQSSTQMYYIRDKKTKAPLQVELPEGTVTALQPGWKRDNGKEIVGKMDTKAFTYFHPNPQDCPIEVSELMKKMRDFEIQAYEAVRQCAAAPAKWKKYTTMAGVDGALSVVKDNNPDMPVSLGLSFYLTKESTTPDNAFVSVKASYNKRLYDRIKGLSKGAVIRAIVEPMWVWVGQGQFGVAWIVRHLLIKSNVATILTPAWNNEDTNTDGTELRVASPNSKVPGEDGEEHDAG
jgi:hypothetical protein